MDMKGWCWAFIKVCYEECKTLEDQDENSSELKAGGEIQGW
jgi:hypothetical protein